MARIKNALRGHFIGKVDPTDKTKVPTEWLELADWIQEIEDDTDETVETTGYYSGDGTPEEDVTAIAEKWTVNGTYDEENEAMAYIGSLKRVLGNDRKVWHKIVQTNGDIYKEIATVTGIKAGGGDATVFEPFACVLNFDKIPVKETP